MDSDRGRVSSFYHIYLLVYSLMSTASQYTFTQHFAHNKLLSCITNSAPLIGFCRLYTVTQGKRVDEYLYFWHVLVML